MTHSETSAPTRLHPLYCLTVTSPVFKPVREKTELLSTAARPLFPLRSAFLDLPTIHSPALSKLHSLLSFLLGLVSGWVVIRLEAITYTKKAVDGLSWDHFPC